MPKKEWTPEERAAFSAKMKKVRAEKLAQKAQTQTEGNDTAPAEPTFDDVKNAQHEPVDPGVQNVDLGDILRRLQEVEANAAYWRNQALQGPQQGPQVGANGIAGSLEKYKLDPSYYPDPRKRLAAEPRLKRFAFDENYELEWEISVS